MRDRFNKRDGMWIVDDIVKKYGTDKAWRLFKVSRRTAIDVDDLLNDLALAGARDGELERVYNFLYTTRKSKQDNDSTPAQRRRMNTKRDDAVPSRKRFDLEDVDRRTAPFSRRTEAKERTNRHEEPKERISRRTESRERVNRVDDRYYEEL